MTQKDGNRTSSIDVWFDLRRKELDDIGKTATDERKNRRKGEFVLLIVCFLAVIYTYPVTDLTKNPTIEINAIDLSIPIRDAIAVFPTLIAAVYLLFISAAIRQSVLDGRRAEIYRSLREFEKSGNIPSDNRRFTYWQHFFFRHLLLPSALHARLPSFGPGGVIYGIVNVFVGAVFIFIPYASSVFITVRGHRLLSSGWLLSWDIVCICLMLLSFIGSVISAFTRTKW